MDICFPASRSCLWDERPTEETINLHLTSSGWIQLKLNTNVVDMAMQYSARQSCDTEAWLMATPAIKKSNCIVIEINRFDRGKWIKSDGSVKLHPTIVLPGDIAIHCKVIDRSGNEGHNEGVLTHNLQTLQDAYCLLEQRITGTSVFDYHLLMSLRIVIIKGDHHKITVKGGCVLPSTVTQLHPIQSIPLLPTSLSRNLTSSNSLSVLQSTVRSGYLSMDKCRKLVPLLPSDESIHTLPLVGIWVSGAGSIDHPMVWSMCLHYCHTTSSIDRVYGSGGDSFLVLLPGTDSQLWQCSLVNDSWEWHIGESTFQLSGMATSLELIPSVEGTSAMTLLESSLAQWKKGRGNVPANDSLPLFTPPPRPVSVPSFVSHDLELSCVSEVNGHSQIEVEDRMEPVISNELLQEHQRQLEALQQQVKLLLSDRDSTRNSNHVKEVTVQTTPTNNASTNTGKSLLEGMSLKYDRSSAEEVSGFSRTSSKATCNSDSSGTLTPPISPPTASSILSASFLSRNLTSPECSYSSVEKSCDEEISEPIEQHLIYKRLKSQIEDFLGGSCHATLDAVNDEEMIKSCETLFTADPPTAPPPPNQEDEGEISFINVPKIKFMPNDFSQLTEVTIDSHSNLADMISQKYTSTPNKDDNSTAAVEYSMATQQYLTKHGLFESKPAKILDIERLRNIPKLI